MQSNSLPIRIAIPFANSGIKNTIPVASQIGITGGAASFTDGFPPLTMTPISAGGIPPAGADFNGILNTITIAIRWASAGGGYPFDSAYATTISGYPKGSLLASSDFAGYWLNTIEGNSVTPENDTSATSGWVPAIQYGVTTLTGMAASSVTLTTLQAAKTRITLAGALTANINLVFPAWVRGWTVVNGCTGSFTVTCKTPSGTGVAIPSGMTASIYGDGANISQDANLLGISGRLLNVQTFSASGTYTPTAGTKSIIVKAIGAGGGTDAAPATSTGQVSIVSGAGAGAYAEARFTSGFSGVTVTVGVGGRAGVSGTPTGAIGGTTTFGSLLTAPGGSRGASAGPANPPFAPQGNLSSSAPTGANILGAPGSSSVPAYASSTTSFLGSPGASSFFGGGGWVPAFNNTGISGQAYGSGAGGPSQGPSGALVAGGQGAGGVVIIWEYA